MIYFAYMPVSGTAEILHEMFANRNKKLLNVCNLRLNDQWPYHEDAPYVQEIETKFQCSLRCVPWEDNLDYLNDVCNRYAPNQDIWFATYREQTFKAIAKLQNCKTISINYGPRSYELIRHLWANFQTGKLLRRQVINDAPEKIYQRFLKQGPETLGYSIPYEQYNVADVEIDVEDLYNQIRLEKILIDLDCVCTPNDWAFYQTYVNKVLQAWPNR
jgi:hypothetical protein